ncbi:MAG: hypothetical protein U5O16_12205 [Rhodococcus sp. (in: high G+C Gram-positive bacteria)]|uniref:hypothetical protein n=1 Tax=Rhodococcus sp. TaxID=1831 RepID=UPI002AD7DBCD|nr:hypothetical protein [Rhodococcus sp. (in: high G+C Gram-positive bacteria)]
MRTLEDVRIISLKQYGARPSVACIWPTSARMSSRSSVEHFERRGKVLTDVVGAVCSSAIRRHSSMRVSRGIVQESQTPPRMSSMSFDARAYSAKNNPVMIIGFLSRSTAPRQNDLGEPRLPIRPRSQL